MAATKGLVREAAYKRGIRAIQARKEREKGGKLSA
jgi:hypothetical protein